MVFLLSIKPKYGYAILGGKKKFELRKCIGKPISTGNLIVMYFSTPVKAIMGYFIAGKVLIKKPEELKKELVNYEELGIDDEDWSYILGYHKAMAIEVVNPTKCKPITLDELRKLGIKPPISYMKLKPEQAKILLKKLEIEFNIPQD